MFQRFEPKKHVLKKVSPLCAFGSAQNATFWKKLRFIFVKKHAYHWKELRSPFWKKPRVRLNLSIGFTGQLPNYPLTPFLIPLISLLCLLNNKFSNPNTKKIYNKFPNQLRKKKKKIPCKLGFLKMQNKKTSEYSKIFQMEFVPIYIYSALIQSSQSESSRL